MEDIAPDRDSKAETKEGVSKDFEGALEVLFPGTSMDTCTEAQLAMAVGLPHVRTQKSSAVWASVVGETMCKQLKFQ